MLSEQRDIRAAKAFFRSATATTGFRPDRVTTTAMAPIPGRSAPCWDGRCGTGPAHTSTIVLNRIIVASQAGSDVCAASRAMMPLAASVASMASFATSFAPVAVTTRPSRPPSAAPVSSRRHILHSTSCGRHKADLCPDVDDAKAGARVDRPPNGGS
jgi:hypothetical protein